MKLTEYFKDMLEKPWSEFATMEQDESYTSSQAVVFALIRACANGKLPAIKEALARVDGKVAAEIEVEYPKFYFLFPYADSVATINGGTTTESSVAPATGAEPEQEDEDDDTATSGLRYTLKKMNDEPRALVKLIMDSAKQIDVAVSHKGDIPPSDPKVKSVIIAGLLQMAHKGSMGAIFEVLDQIDGKVADKIKVLGGDVYIQRLDTVAPYGAEKNKDGVYQLIADNTTSAWAAALERKQNERGIGR